MSRIYSLVLTVLVLLGFCECMDMKRSKLPKTALEKCLDYTCSVRARADTIYMSEGGKKGFSMPTEKDEDIVPAQGRSLLQEAMEHGDADVIDILKKKGADPNLTEKFGAAKWNKYFGEVGPEPPIPTHIGALLNQPCKLFRGKKVHETHLLTLIPTTVKRDDIEEPLTLNSFQRLLGNSKEAGYKGGYHYYDAGITEVFGDKTYAISHWVLMTRDIIPGSNDKQYDYQKKFMEHTANRLSIPYTLVSVLEGVVSAMCHHIDTGEKLLPKTVSRGREVFPKRLPDGGFFAVFVGNLTEGGITISHFFGGKCGWCCSSRLPDSVTI